MVFNVTRFSINKLCKINYYYSLQIMEAHTSNKHIYSHLINISPVCIINKSIEATAAEIGSSHFFGTTLLIECHTIYTCLSEIKRAKEGENWQFYSLNLEKASLIIN